MALSDNQIMNLPVDVNRGDPLVNLGQRTMVRIAISFIRYMSWHANHHINPMDYAREHYRRFQMTVYNGGMEYPAFVPAPARALAAIAARAPGAPAAGGPAGGGAGGGAAFTPAQQFQRSIKKDASAYPRFTDDKMWDAYSRKLRARASLEDIAEVLRLRMSLYLVEQRLNKSCGR